MTNQFLDAVPTALQIVKLVILRCRWVCGIPLLSTFFTLVLGWQTGSWNSFTIFCGLFLHAAGGLIGSYSLHEAAHAFVLRLYPGVKSIHIEANLLRFSITPIGTITAGRAFLTAISGPGICIVAGAILYCIPLSRNFSWWYLGHAVFLLPLFGDGRMVLRSLYRLANAWITRAELLHKHCKTK